MIAAYKRTAEKLFPEKYITVHSFRKSFPMYLINEKGVQPKTLHEILRHSDMNTTMTFYTDKELDRLESAINPKEVLGKNWVAKQKPKSKATSNLLESNNLRLVTLNQS